MNINLENSIVEDLLAIDNRIMNDHLTKDELMKHQFDQTNLNLNHALIFYDGSPITTIKLVNSCIHDSVLYPNHSYLAINRFLVKDTDLHLSLEENDIKLEKASSVFEEIVLINSKEILPELKKLYPNIKYIEI